ncbi:unnamed protein product [Brassica oleracea var. botrytis]|uniref:DUF1985 domain-containing protein n=1 Tax=Brassica oleracea TaxID=3712 RepID=A0A3P6E7S8_BRAOL|nr:unnamed protein product [Brassica oleracea]
MDKLDFPQRLYILGKESFPTKSIAYYSEESKLFPDLKEALEADGWEELKNSRLVVFLKFHKMKFGCASRLIPGLNCEYLNNLENPLVEVTDDMKAFWGKIGVNFDRGSSIDELTAARQMCRTWSREDRLRLAIYAGFIEAPRTSSPT